MCCRCMCKRVTLYMRIMSVLLRIYINSLGPIQKPMLKAEKSKLPFPCLQSVLEECSPTEDDPSKEKERRFGTSQPVFCRKTNWSRAISNVSGFGERARTKSKNELEERYQSAVQTQKKLKDLYKNKDIAKHASKIQCSIYISATCIWDILNDSVN